MSIKFGFKEIFSLFCIPLIFFIGFITESFDTGTYTKATVDTSLRIILFIALFVMFKDYLAQEWNKFKNLKFYKWLIIIAGAILLQVIISIVNQFVPSVHTNEVVPNPSENIDFLTVSTKLFYLLIFISIGPVVTSLIEDITFRYTLLEKLLSKNIIFNVLLVLVNSALFGAIHYYNFGGSLINTIPYMFAGLFLNCIYLWTRNIWHVLLIHFFNNFVLSIGGILIMGIIRIIMN
ncbi:CPBP family intramembrane glutamic endopeptidase [Mammaliicoccus sciuri]|uniref:CPBP family intramembrane glutamic endopeptidase n=1 Tax=Mammaliicoccus sciuri TaxID=1296 RepID=UPI001E4665EC|nr:CPBP family intramembrane glutamic endopeptidase [Mammaliicoccus sciuri]MCD8898515.1 CPBP family intramembrane metalloprotease [Mammaliicoccus sciuri]